MPTTVGRLKEGSLLLAGEVDERVLPVTSGLIGYYPLDGDISDKLTEYKTNSIIMTNRDWSAAIFPTQHDYGDKKWLITGKIRCTAAADWTKNIGIGFQWNTNLEGAAATYNWIKGKSWACQDVKEWTEFTFVQTIGTNYTYGLRPWAQIDITAGTAGYRVEYEDVNYKLLTDMNVYTNTQFNEEGALVQKATTNRIDPKAITNAYPSEWSVEEIAPYTYKITALINGPTVGYPVRTGTYSAAANEAVTLSAELIYASKPGMAMGCNGFGYLQETSSGGGMLGKRTYRMIKHTVAWSHQLALCYVNANAQNSILVGDYMIVRAPQIESLAFPTSFVDGSRTDAHLRFTTPPMLGNHTLHFEYRHPDLSGYGSNMVIASSYNGSNAGNWFGLNGGTNTISTMSGGTSPINVWNKATFVYDGATTTLYLNGVQKGSFTGKFFFNADIISFSSMYGWVNTIHLAAWGIRNVAIYNRALSASEITKLNAPPFSIKKNGDVTSDLKEGSNSLPSGATHFPFGHDAKDITHSITPITESNVAYENGAAWVGKAITNLSDVNYLSGFENSGSGTRTKDPAEMPRLFPNAPVMRYVKGAVDATSGVGNGVIQIGKTPTVAVSTAFSASVWAWIDIQPDETGNKTIYLREFYDGGNSTKANLTYNGVSAIHLLPQRKWIKLTVENATTRADLNPYLLINVYLDKPDSRVYLTAPQIEQSTFVSPFVVGTRGAGRIELPGELITGSNFAFSMWAKVNAFDNTFNMPMDAYPHLYVAMRESYLHFSFLNNGTQTNLTGGTLVKGKWHHIAGIKTSAKVEMYLDGKLITSHTSSGTGYANTIDGDGDISIGCYDNTYPLNGYVRDLIIEKDTITLNASKILDIYKSQLRAYKNNRIQVQHQVREGVL